MRITFAYTTARITLFFVAGGLAYLCGARSWLLLMLAVVISSIASYVLLSRQRDKMSAALVARRENRATQRVSVGARLDAGASAEDSD